MWFGYKVSICLWISDEFLTMGQFFLLCCLVNLCNKPKTNLIDPNNNKLMTTIKLSKRTEEKEKEKEWKRIERKREKEREPNRKKYLINVIDRKYGLSMFCSGGFLYKPTKQIENAHFVHLQLHFSRTSFVYIGKCPKQMKKVH